MTSIKTIAPNYDLFLVDQFGVIHDGAQPFPNSIATMQAVRNAGKRLVIISNSGKRATQNEQRLIEMGFNENCWDAIVTSGEVAWHSLSQIPIGKRPKKCLILSRGNDTSPIDNLGIQTSDNPNNVDLIIIAGSRAPEMSLDDYRDILEPCIARGVPAICINPDVKMIVPNQQDNLPFGPGKIALLYEKMGGKVGFYGKPHRLIYDHIRDILKYRGKTLCIGDSIQHDILGAKNIGAESLLVMSGIHTESEDLSKLYLKWDAHPNHVSDQFSWD